VGYRRSIRSSGGKGRWVGEDCWFGRLLSIASTKGFEYMTREAKSVRVMAGSMLIGVVI